MRKTSRGRQDKQLQLDDNHRISPAAWAVVGAVFLVAVIGNGWLHPVPLYATETDLVGDYIPTARALASFAIVPDNFETKGPGYPLLLALWAPIVGGDYFVAAKCLNCVAGAVVSLLVAAIFAGTVGRMAGLLVLIGVALNPTFWRAILEAGTDLPAMALALGACYFVLRGNGWRDALWGGCLTGLAMLTRTNYVCVLIAGCGFLATRKNTRGLLAFISGTAAPLLAWAVFCLGVMGRFPIDRNYLNVAYGLYGRGLSWEDFLTRDARHFGSYRDVVLFNPVAATTGLLRSAASHAWQDAVVLLPVPLGLLAAVGIGLLWGRQRAVSFLIWFLASTFLVLAPVFYSARFSLFELPFLLSGAALAVVAALEWSKRRGTYAVVGVVTIACGCAVASGVHSVTSAMDLLRNPPLVAREIGRQLLAQRAEGLIMARKPHVAYYAELPYATLPREPTIGDLVFVAARSRVSYVFVSSREAGLRPEYQVLAQPGVQLPGLRQVAFADQNGVQAAAYRVEPPLQPQSAERIGIAAALGRLQNSGEVELAIGTELLYAGEYEEALKHFVAARDLRPEDADVAGFESNALHALRRYDEAAQACLRAISLGGGSSERYSQLGRIRYMQGRSPEAIAAFREAIARNVTDTADRYLLGLAYYSEGQYSEAASEFAAYLRTDPTATDVVEMQARSLARAGDVAGALDVIERNSSSPELQHLADSLRTAHP